jgi:hypothetical protein
MPFRAVHGPLRGEAQVSGRELTYYVSSGVTPSATRKRATML